jgi:hypothetical protein
VVIDFSKYLNRILELRLPDATFSRRGGVDPVALAHRGNRDFRACSGIRFCVVMLQRNA